jgi:DNA-binding XRE family transcriptional regulator
VYTSLCHYLIIHVDVYTSINDVEQNQDRDLISFMTLRSRTGLTQEDLAAQLSREFKVLGSYRKVTKKSISDWETGRHKPRFTPEETLAVCTILGCSLNELAKASQFAISAVAA